MEEKIEALENKTKFLTFLVVINLVLTVFFIGAVNDTKSNTSSDETTTTESTEYDVSTFNEISAADISNFKKNTTYVVYIGRLGCSWCIKMLPNIKQAQEEYGYTTQYIDISKIIDYSTETIIDQDAYDIMTSLESASDDVEAVSKEFGATPMMLVIKNGKVIANQVGYSDYATYATFLESAGISK